MRRRYWLIRGYGLRGEKIFERRVALGQFTKAQIQFLLRALVARAGLNFDEIVGAYARRKTKIANDLLGVHKESAQLVYMCGDCPNFTASVVDEAGKIIKHPKI